MYADERSKLTNRLKGLFFFVWRGASNTSSYRSQNDREYELNGCEEGLLGAWGLFSLSKRKKNGFKSALQRKERMCVVG